MIETVGQSTWDHSLKSLRPEVVVIAGATSGSAPSADSSRVRDGYQAMLDGTIHGKIAVLIGGA